MRRAHRWARLSAQQRAQQLDSAHAQQARPLAAPRPRPPTAPPHHHRTASPPQIETINLEGYLFEDLHKLVQSKGFVLTKGAPPVQLSGGQQASGSGSAGSGQLKGPLGTGVNAQQANNLRQELSTRTKQSHAASFGGGQQQAHVIGGWPPLAAWLPGWLGVEAASR
jgi:hypothetical protein